MRRTASILPRLVGLAVLSLPLAAAANTDTGTLNVTATVQSSCAVDGGTMNFGAYNSGQQAALDVEGSISYSNCTGELTFELDGGTSGDTNNRTMTSGDNQLAYQLYRTAARNAVWGEGTNAHQVSIFDEEPQSDTVTVYGRIPGGQAVAPGTYTDTITITMTF